MVIWFTRLVIYSAVLTMNADKWLLALERLIFADGVPLAFEGLTFLISFGLGRAAARQVSLLCKERRFQEVGGQCALLGLWRHRFLLGRSTQ
jgi:hypothetical protein